MNYETIIKKINKIINYFFYVKLNKNYVIFFYINLIKIFLILILQLLIISKLNFLALALRSKFNLF